jgi:hypothetical protein
MGRRTKALRLGSRALGRPSPPANEAVRMLPADRTEGFRCPRCNRSYLPTDLTFIKDRQVEMRNIRQ